MITKAQLRKGLPPVLYTKKGTINVVLAYWRQESENNSSWMVVNTAYYTAHPEQFVGWIEIEHPATYRRPKKAPK